MQIAKWNEQTQTPYDIRDRYSVKASNGVPYSSMASLERLGYHEYLPIQLAEGEGLDNPTWSNDGIIRQGGTVISAEVMQQRNAQAALDAKRADMLAQITQPDGTLNQGIVGLAVAYRTILQAMFGAGAETNHAITRDVVVGTLMQLPPDQYDAKTADLLKMAFEQLTAITGDGTTWTFYELLGDVLGAEG